MASTSEFDRSCLEDAVATQDVYIILIEKRIRLPTLGSAGRT